MKSDRMGPDIALVPIGHVPSGLLPWLAGRLAEVIGQHVGIGELVALPASAYDARRPTSSRPSIASCRDGPATSTSSTARRPSAPCDGSSPNGSASTSGANTGSGRGGIRPSPIPPCTGGSVSTACRRVRRGAFLRLLCDDGDRRVPPTAGFDEGVLASEQGRAREAPPDERGGNS